MPSSSMTHGRPDRSRTRDARVLGAPRVAHGRRALFHYFWHPKRIPIAGNWFDQDNVYIAVPRAKRMNWYKFVAKKLAQRAKNGER